MKWIKHDTDANQDNKLQNVLLDYGLEGYGLYWYCLELIGSKVDKDKLTFELEHDARVIARNVGSSAQRVEEMMKYFVNQGLFECVDNTITCLAMAKRLDKSMTSNPEMRRLIANLNQNSTVKEGYVYAIVGEREGSTAEIKIGRSANPHSRFKEHEKKYSEFGYSLELIGTIKSDDCISLETEIHRKLKDFQIRKEWFYLTEDVQNILRHDYGLTTTCKNRLDKISLDETKLIPDNGSEEPKQKRATQIPEDFKPNETNIRVAKESCVDISYQLNQFIDHHIAKGSKFKDWNRAFNTWIRKSVEFSQGKGFQQNAPQPIKYKEL